MLIHGLQKMTLLDFPGKVACTVFLDGCNFRCPFCHNSELLGAGFPPLMEDSELLAFLEKRKRLLDGVCITGGEPLVQKELPRLLEQIKAKGYPVKLDTNGSFPEKLSLLIDGGLVDYVAMDIKNSPERYSETVGRERFDISAVEQSVDLLMQGKLDYEFRTTVVEQLHDEASFHGIGQWIRGAKRYYLQCFVPRDTVLQPGLDAPTEEKIRSYAEIARKYVPETGVRGI